MTDINKFFWQRLGVEAKKYAHFIYRKKQLKSQISGNKIGWARTQVYGNLEELRQNHEITHFSEENPTISPSQILELEELIFSKGLEIYYRVNRPGQEGYEINILRQGMILGEYGLGKTRPAALQSLIIKLIDAGVLTVEEVREVLNDGH